MNQSFLESKRYHEADLHHFQTPAEMYRQQYFLVLDEVVNEINRRFDQENLNIVIDIEKLLLKW